MQLIVSGTAEVIAKLTLMEKLAHAAIKDGIEKGGLMWERAAKYDAGPPVDTGRYRASIGHWTAGDIVDTDNLASDAGPGDAVWEMAKEGNVVTLTVGTNVYYAEHIEAEHGIFATAVDLTVEPITELVRSNVLAAIMGVGK